MTAHQAFKPHVERMITKLLDAPEAVQRELGSADVLSAASVVTAYYTVLVKAAQALIEIARQDGTPEDVERLRQNFVSLGEDFISAVKAEIAIGSGMNKGNSQ